MSVVSEMIRELLENGVHFGHQTSKWNPKMRKFIFGKKSGIYIIDLEKTEKALLTASEVVYNLAREGKKILFAGTKKQAKPIVREEAERCGMFFVEERWLGGC
ncbi:MAG: 30S ribosomal protein S2, partial [Candidatus Omnitrophica bacterium]|nr:30S ribosomal protein S2 [Candidatus Omnitrophota bacterium]